MARQLTPLELWVMDELNQNVHEDILVKLGMDSTDKILTPRIGMLKFRDTNFHHRLSGKLERTTGAITVHLRENNNFDVILEVGRLRQRITHLNLTGAQLEDLFIELADI